MVVGAWVSHHESLMGVGELGKTSWVCGRKRGIREEKEPGNEVVRARALFPNSSLILRRSRSRRECVKSRERRPGPSENQLGYSNSGW